MKLSQIILFSFIVVLFIIGVHQTMLYGIENAYFIFMFCAAGLLFYYYRKKRDEDPQSVKNNKSKTK